MISIQRTHSFTKMKAATHLIAHARVTPVVAISFELTSCQMRMVRTGTLLSVFGAVVDASSSNRLHLMASSTLHRSLSLQTRSKSSSFCLSARRWALPVRFLDFGKTLATSIRKAMCCHTTRLHRRALEPTGVFRCSSSGTRRIRCS